MRHRLLAIVFVALVCSSVARASDVSFVFASHDGARLPLWPPVHAKSAQQPRPGAGSGAFQDYLNRAADAILALKSTRFSLKREGSPAFLDEKNGITFTAADCVYAAPDRVSCNVKVALKNGTIVQLTRVWVPEGTFQSNPLTRQFARMPADSNFNGVVLFARTGIPDILRTGVQKGQLVGREKISNRDTLHLKGDVSGEKLNPLIGATLKPELMYPVDLWIDEKSAHPVQLHVAEPEGGGWFIELAGTDEPVDIPTPRIPPPPAGRP
jgi:LppX_LprAFG lipoprotein